MKVAERALGLRAGQPPHRFAGGLARAVVEAAHGRLAARGGWALNEKHREPTKAEEEAIRLSRIMLVQLGMPTPPRSHS